MIGMTYNIIETSDYKDFRYVHLAKHLNAFLQQHNWSYDSATPQYTFLISDSIKPENILSKCFRVIFLSDLHIHYRDIAFIKEPFLIIRDFDTNISIPSRSCTRTVPYPLPKSDQDSVFPSSINKIFVSCQAVFFKNDTILKLLLPLNKISRIPILIDTADNRIAGCLNDNISLVNPENQLDVFVKQSDLIIGSGVAIVEAIIQRKYFIIAGETGYGGIPDNRNIYRFSDLFFQGSIGGHLFDPIPDTLILDDIISIENGTRNISFYETIDDLSLRIFKDWINAISFFDKNDGYRFNTDFTIVKQSCHYYILNRYNRNRILEISPTDASALSKNRIEAIDETIANDLINMNILI